MRKTLYNLLILIAYKYQYLYRPKKERHSLIFKSMEKHGADGFADSAIELKDGELVSPRSVDSEGMAEPEDDRPPPGLVRQRVDNVSVSLGFFCVKCPVYIIQGCCPNNFILIGRMLHFDHYLDVGRRNSE